MIKKILILFLVINICVAAENRNNDLYQKRESAKDVFSLVKKGLEESNISVFANYLQTKTYISLFNGVSGYFSQDQSYYVLADFLKSITVFDVKFQSIRAGARHPFVSGKLIYFHRGARKKARVFVSLERKKGNWQITQITIN